MHDIDIPDAERELTAAVVFSVTKECREAMRPQWPRGRNPMGEVVVFDPTAKRSSPSSQKLPYESYVAYRQAEAAFRALYFGRPLDMEPLTNRPCSEIVQRHWSTVQELAETLLREKSLTREQVLKLLLHASLDAAVGAEP